MSADSDSAWRRGAPSTSTSSGGAGAWGKGAPVVSKPPNNNSNGERTKLNLSKKTEPVSKDKENNTSSSQPKKPEETTTKPVVEKRGWEVKPTKSTESVTTANSKEKDIEEKKEDDKSSTSAPAVRSFAAMAAKPAAAPPPAPVVDGKPEVEKKKEDSPTKKDGEKNKAGESSNNKDGEKKHRRDRRGERERKPREPRVMNSRAAMLGDAAAPKKEELAPKENERHVRDKRSGDRRGPPPVINERFAKLAEEEKEKNDFRCRDNGAAADNRDNRERDRGGPTPMQTNSRFAAVAADNDAERAARDVQRAEREANRMSPPPIQTNSRFAAVAADNDVERANREMERGGDRFGRNDGPPPMQTNSRFAAVAADNDAERANREMERAERMGSGGDRFGRNEGPPPMQTNSRFAAAADAHQRENESRDRERGERMGCGGGDNRFGRNDNASGPPPMQTGRFANLVQDDEDYVPAEVRNQRLQERKMEEQEGGGRFGGQDGGGRFGRLDDDRGGGSRFGGRDQQRGGNRYGRGNDGGEVQLPTQPRWKTEAENQEDAFPPLGGNKGNVAGILAPKDRDEVVQAPVEAPLTLPGEDEAAAKARIEKKKREDEEKKALEKAAAEEAAAKQAALEKAAAEEAAKAAAVESKLLDEFVSGNKLGEDLQAWCTEQGTVLPTVEKLIFHLLCEKEQKNPDPECAWAEPDKFGAALVPLVEDDADGQMQVLWAIQKYCDTQGFPKINDEYLVQAMFRAMYKFDLAEPGAFDLWKEDESEVNEKGKMKAVIQTMDWFTWLEEDDDDDGEEEEYEEEEE